MNFRFVKKFRAYAIKICLIVGYLFISQISYSQASVQANFSAPDTVCANAPVKIINLSNSDTNYWNFCTGNLNNNPVCTSLSNLSLSRPVFMDFAEENGNYYGFVVNNDATLTELFFGNSLLNNPTSKSWGSLNGQIPNNTEGIKLVFNENKWYAIIVGGLETVGTASIVRISFGASLSNTATTQPIATNWGNTGGLNYPVGLDIIKVGTDWYGFTVNAFSNTFTRFNFGTSFENVPTSTNINVSGLNFPTGLHFINNVGNWSVFITNAGGGGINATPSSLSRVDFGSSILNTNPTSKNLGDLNGVLQSPRDIHIFKQCNSTIGYIVNHNSKNDIVRIKLDDNLNVTSQVSLGNIGNFSFPHSLSKIFRVGPDVYSFVANVDNATLTRLQFPGCTNANIPNSSSRNPPTITYNTPGTYNINLTVDEGLPTQSSFCKPIVVRPPSTNLDFNFTQDDCNPLLITLQNKSNPLTGFNYSWDFGDGTSATGLNDLTAYKYYNKFNDYTISLTNTSGCTDTIKKIIPVRLTSDSLITSKDTTICLGSSFTLKTIGSVASAKSNCWKPAIGLSDSTISNPIAKPTVNTTYFLNSKLIGNNLVVNGDFEKGNTLFTTTYNNTANTNGYPEWSYTVDTTAAIWHPFIARCHDHTSGKGKMLIANGAPTSGNAVWQQTINSILPNTNYIFSTWLQSMSIENPAQIRFYINGKPISESFTAVLDTCYWQQPLTTWNSGNNTSATIAIVNEDTIGNGNDFALDDISFYSNVIKTDSVRITVNSILPSPTVDTTICTGQSITLNAASANTYTWNASPYISNNNLQSQIVTPTSSTQFTITRYNATGCSVTDTFNVTISNNKPQLDFSFSEDICNPLAIQFKNEAVGNFNYSWSFGNNTFSNSTNPSVVYSSYGSFPVMLKNTNGCADSITKNITIGVFQDSVITTRDTTLCPGSSLTLSTMPALAYCWSPSTGLSNANSKAPIVSSLTKTITYHVNAQVEGKNIIVNGDFSQGNVGINSDYKFTTFNDKEGQYTVAANPITWNLGMNACSDHTTGNGNMLVVNGAPDPDKAIWKQTVSVTQNTNYAFSTWLQPVSIENPAQLKFSINGKSIGNLITAALPLCNWQQFYTIWNSGSNTTATISIINKNLLSAGNDFALDDISFAPFFIKTDSIKITVDTSVSPSPTIDTTICIGQTITLNAANAASYQWINSPYISNNSLQSQTIKPTSNVFLTVNRYNLSGCSIADTFNISVLNNKPQLDFSFTEDICNPLSVQFKNETVGSFNYSWSFGNNTFSNNTNPSLNYASYGSFPVMLKNTTGCADSITKNITIGVMLDSVIITKDTIICPNKQLQLFTVPALAYCWSPSNGLSNAGIGNPTLTVPNSTTTYYVNAKIAGINLIVNGDFSLDTIDFNSAYSYDSKSGKNQGVYWVGASPQLQPNPWHKGFGFCTDHTSGTGNFMMINGASTPGDIAWNEKIKVTPNTNYAFSAWAESLSGSNPAQLQFTINGKTIGSIFTANANTCIWDNFYVVWNSGTNTNANISIINLNTTSGGNDFGLDDISFAKLDIIRDSITITPAPIPVVSIINTDSAICVNDSFQVVATGASTYKWNNSNYLSSTTIANPIAKPSQTTSFIVTGFNAFDCSASDTLNVVVNALPIISITPNTGICLGDSVQLSAKNSNAKSFSWQSNLSLSALNISDPYAKPKDTTKYIVTVTDNNNCTNKDSTLVAVWSLPTVKTRTDTSICFQSNATLTTNSTNANSFVWTPSVGLSDTKTQSPTDTASFSGTIQYIVTAYSNHNCITTDTVNITSKDLPLVSISNTRPVSICEGKFVALSAIANNVKSYKWFPSTGLSLNTVSNPIANPTINTKYFITVTGQNDCEATDSVIIDVKQMPIFAITPTIASVCKGDSLLITASGGNKYVWDASNNVKYPDSSANIVYPIANTTYKVIASDTVCGIPKLLTVSVTLNGSPDVNVYKTNDVDCILTTSTLIANGAASYLWSPASTLSDSTSASIIATPSQTTVYTLKAFSSSGCITEKSIKVNVTKGDIGNGYQIPNAFTPMLTTNACFGVKEWGHVNSFRMNIYNRFGQKIFSANSLNGCWDGRLNGILQPPGTYVVEIDASTLCAEIHRKGTVVLIR